jgi:glycerol-3-phosphate acyltransferase PlsX
MVAAPRGPDADPPTMTRATIRLSIDAMGGDHGPDMVVPGLAVALVRCPELTFDLFGDRAAIERALLPHQRLAAVSSVHHAAVAIPMDAKPSQALRMGRRDSSMWRALDHVRSGGAMATVSAGNTGALMTMAKVCLRGMEGIDRPALAAIWPTVRGECIVLDVGASIGVDTRNLVTHALLGAAMSRAVFGIEAPRVGLLNIGVEEVKGLEEVREAGQILRTRNFPGLRYEGFVEGDDIGRGVVDVVVTEGFSGNIALKTAEGTARQLAQYLRMSIGRTLRARLGYLLAKPAFIRLRDKMDPRKINGAVFLGLNGLVIKSHGGTDAEGFASAVELAHDMVRNDLPRRIAADVSALKELELADAS